MVPKKLNTIFFLFPIIFQIVGDGFVLFVRTSLSFRKKFSEALQQ